MEHLVEPLVHVIYACACSAEVHEHEILTLLKQSRIANRKNDVSGMLLYPGECFLQLFEGEERMVDAVCSTLFRTKPRLRLTQLVREAISEREFPEWTMGFVTVDPKEAGQLLGDDDLFQSATTATRLDAHGAKTLISIFGRRRYQSDRSGMYRAIKSIYGAGH
jgi:hypothetical protein